MNKNVKALQSVTNVAKAYYKISAIKKILTFALIGYAIYKGVSLILLKK